MRNCNPRRKGEREREQNRCKMGRATNWEIAKIHKNQATDSKSTSNLKQDKHTWYKTSVVLLKKKRNLYIGIKKTTNYLRMWSSKTDTWLLHRNSGGQKIMEGHWKHWKETVHLQFGTIRSSLHVLKENRDISGCQKLRTHHQQIYTNRKTKKSYTCRRKMIPNESLRSRKE